MYCIVICFNLYVYLLLCTLIILFVLCYIICKCFLFLSYLSVLLYSLNLFVRMFWETIRNRVFLWCYKHAKSVRIGISLQWVNCHHTVSNCVKKLLQYNLIQSFLLLYYLLWTISCVVWASSGPVLYSSGRGRLLSHQYFYNNVHPSSPHFE